MPITRRPRHSVELLRNVTFTFTALAIPPAGAFVDPHIDAVAVKTPSIDAADPESPTLELFREPIEYVASGQVHGTWEKQKVVRYNKGVLWLGGSVIDLG